MEQTRWYCQSCGWSHDSLVAAASHENQRHDGAQTCWSDQEAQPPIAGECQCATTTPHDAGCIVGVITGEAMYEAAVRLWTVSHRSAGAEGSAR